MHIGQHVTTTIDGQSGVIDDTAPMPDGDTLYRVRFPAAVGGAWSEGWFQGRYLSGAVT